MKKQLLLPFSIAITFGLLFSISACNTEKPKQQTISQAENSDRTVQLDKCGLQYEVPEEWIPYEQTNIIPITNTTTEGDIYAQIQYNYVTNEGMEQLATFENIIIRPNYDKHFAHRHHHLTNQVFYSFF